MKATVKFNNIVGIDILNHIQQGSNEHIVTFQNHVVLKMFSIVIKT